jgi:hypothetical protein
VCLLFFDYRYRVLAFILGATRIFMCPTYHIIGTLVLKVQVLAYGILSIKMVINDCFEDGDHHDMAFMVEPFCCCAHPCGDRDVPIVGNSWDNDV